LWSATLRVYAVDSGCPRATVLVYVLCCGQQHYVPMPWTLGVLERPLGNARLQTTCLIATLLGSNSSSVNDELLRLGTVSVLLVCDMTITVLESWCYFSLDTLLFEADISRNVFYVCCFNDGDFTRQISLRIFARMLLHNCVSDDKIQSVRVLIIVKDWKIDLDVTNSRCHHKAVCSNRCR